MDHVRTAAFRGSSTLIEFAGPSSPIHYYVALHTQWISSLITIYIAHRNLTRISSSIQSVKRLKISKTMTAIYSITRTNAIRRMPKNGSTTAKQLVKSSMNNRCRFWPPRRRRRRRPRRPRRRRRPRRPRRRRRRRRLAIRDRQRDRQRDRPSRLAYISLYSYLS